MLHCDLPTDNSRERLRKLLLTRSRHTCSQHRNREPECGTFAGLRFHPYLTTMRCHDASAHGQSDPGARIRILIVQAFVYCEDTLMEILSDSNPVILHGKLPVVALLQS